MGRVSGATSMIREAWMKKIRLLSMASTFLLVASLAISADAVISEPYSPDRQNVTFGGERVSRTSQQVSTTNKVSDEVLLIASVIIGLIGITIMRKTLH